MVLCLPEKGKDNFTVPCEGRAELYQVFLGAEPGPGVKVLITEVPGASPRSVTSPGLEVWISVSRQSCLDCSYLSLFKNTSRAWHGCERMPAIPALKSLMQDHEFKASLGYVGYSISNKRPNPPPPHTHTLTHSCPGMR